MSTRVETTGIHHTRQLINSTIAPHHSSMKGYTRHSTAVLSTISDVRRTNQRNLTRHVMKNLPNITNQSEFSNLTTTAAANITTIQDGKGADGAKGHRSKVEAIILATVAFVLIAILLALLRRTYKKQPKDKNRQVSDERRSTLLTASDERRSTLSTLKERRDTLKERRDTLLEFFNNKHETFFCSCIPESRTAPYTVEVDEVVHQLHYDADQSEDESSNEDQYSLNELTYVIQLKSQQRDALAKLLDKKPEEDWLSIAEILANGDESLVYRIRNHRPVISTASTPSRALFRHLLVQLPDLPVSDLAQVANKIGRTRIVDYIYQQNLNNLVFSHLKFYHMNHLAQLLDQKHQGMKSSHIGDWTACAAQFGLTKYKIKALKKESDEKQYSPALIMLSVLAEYLPELELSELRHAALCIEREDIVAYIEGLMSGTTIPSDPAVVTVDCNTSSLDEEKRESNVFE